MSTAKWQNIAGSKKIFSLQDKDMPSTLKSIYQAPNKGTQKVLGLAGRLIT